VPTVMTLRASRSGPPLLNWPPNEPVDLDDSSVLRLDGVRGVIAACRVRADLDHKAWTFEVTLVEGAGEGEVPGALLALREAGVLPEDLGLVD
jgi:hypothetical protein